MSARVVYIQVLEHDHYVAEAASEHLESAKYAAPAAPSSTASGFPLAISTRHLRRLVDRRVWRSDLTRSPTRSPRPSRRSPSCPQDRLMNMLLDTSNGPITMLATGARVRRRPGHRQDEPAGRRARAGHAPRLPRR